MSVDRLKISAGAGIDSDPDSSRVSELKQLGAIVSEEHAAGTNAVSA